MFDPGIFLGHLLGLKSIHPKFIQKQIATQNIEHNAKRLPKWSRFRPFLPISDSSYFSYCSLSFICFLTPGPEGTLRGGGFDRGCGGGLDAESLVLTGFLNDSGDIDRWRI
jgi:hypothetical protein